MTSCRDCDRLSRMGLRRALATHIQSKHCVGPQLAELAARLLCEGEELVIELDRCGMWMQVAIQGRML